MDAERDIEQRSPSEIAASLRSALRGGVVIVGPGQFSPYREHSRVSVLRVDGGGKPAIVWDRFLRDEAIPELRKALRAFCDVLEGELDTMYATPWSLAWTVPPSRFQVYDRGGLLAAQEGRFARVFSRSGQPVSVPLDEIESVLGWISDDWVARGVSLVMRGGERVVIAEVEDKFALIDPTYDGINLLFEAAWAAEMGKAIAKGLGVPYVAGDPALE